MPKNYHKNATESISHLRRNSLSPLDLLPHQDLREKCIDLVFNGIPDNIDQQSGSHFHELRQHLISSRSAQTRVVVFGGGSGLSNIIGGDSRLPGWTRNPFVGLKEMFPLTRSIVCVTDDGGSTGELIKDLPLIALGDLRHVLLSSVQLRQLQKKYSVSYDEAMEIARGLSFLFNQRFSAGTISPQSLQDTYDQACELMPPVLKQYLSRLCNTLFSDPRLADTLQRAHCLGNLLLAASIYGYIDPKLDNISLESNLEVVSEAIYHGLGSLAEALGVSDYGVMPCTSTPAQLRICYTNGVQATGECKSGTAVRGYPVDRVIVDFSDVVSVHERILRDIAEAEIIILAPGSLYSSIIPIFQVPGIADAVRQNTGAFKILVSNLWVQAGETDIAISDPERKFHVSDMLRAYERNIPGGTKDLFREILCLSLKDVPGSILQNYALEGKIPIYLDKNIVRSQGFIPVECGIYSKKSLAERGVIQHDPELVTHAIKTVYLSQKLITDEDSSGRASPFAQNLAAEFSVNKQMGAYPSKKYRNLAELLTSIPIFRHNDIAESEFATKTQKIITEIIWKHQDIPLSHLNYVKGIVCVDKPEWDREQIWDRVFSFYDPEDSMVKIRADQFRDPRLLEIAILIAIGQSLLGNYADRKYMEEIMVNGLPVGKIYHLHLRQEESLHCHLNLAELDQYLKFARMFQPDKKSLHYTRLVNGLEGFTPPGVLMGLTYAWYLDNRLASHIEYKMALMKIRKSDLIPEQLKMLARRNSLIHFFRETVFSE